MKKTKSATSKFPLSYNVTYTLRDKAGKIKKIFQPNKAGLKFAKWVGFLPKIFLFGSMAEKMVIPNLITNAGFAGVASVINGDGGEAPFTYIAMGTGTTAANVTNTTLENEETVGDGNGLERVAATPSRITTDVTNDTAKLTTTFSVTGTVAVTESGVLNAASSGTLLARQVFAAVNVVNGDNLAVDWTFDVD